MLISFNDSEVELGEVFSEEGKEISMGKAWIPIVLRKETTLPVRRIISFYVQLTDQRVAFEVGEVKVGIRVGKVMLPSKLDEDEDEEVKIEVKHRMLNKEVFLGALEMRGERQG